MYLVMRRAWASELEAYRVEQRMRGQSAATVRLRMSFLVRFAEAVPVVAASRADMIAWLASHEHWSPQTRSSARSALVSFYRWRVLSGRAEANPASDLPSVRIPPRLPRPAREDQVAAGCASTHPHAPLMVALAARAGLRRGEIARLRREDLTAEGLLVRGKGGRERLLPIGEDLRAAILARPPGWLFPGRGGRHVHHDTVARWIKRASGSAPHALRHRFATRVYGARRDLLSTQRLLGHASPATTQVYVALASDVLAEAMEAAA